MPGIWDSESKATKKDKPFGFGRTAAKPPARLNVATRHDVDKAAGLASKFEEFFHALKHKYSEEGVPEASLNIMFDEISNLHVSLVKSINDKHLEDEGGKILDALEPALFSGASVSFDDLRLKEIENECNDFLDKYRSAISSIPLRQRDKRSLVRKFFSFNEVALQVAGAAGLVSAAGALALAQHKLVGASVSVLSDRMADVITKRFIKVSKAIAEVPRLDIRLDKTAQSTWASAPVGGILYPLAKMLLAAAAGAGATYGIVADRLNAVSAGDKQTSLDQENRRLRDELQEASTKNLNDDHGGAAHIKSEAVQILHRELEACQRAHNACNEHAESRQREVENLHRELIHFREEYNMQQKNAEELRSQFIKINEKLSDNDQVKELAETQKLLLSQEKEKYESELETAKAHYESRFEKESRNIQEREQQACQRILQHEYDGILDQEKKKLRDHFNKKIRESGDLMTGKLEVCEKIMTQLRERNSALEHHIAYIEQQTQQGVNEFILNAEAGHNDILGQSLQNQQQLMLGYFQTIASGANYKHEEIVNTLQTQLTIQRQEIEKHIADVISVAERRHAEKMNEQRLQFNKHLESTLKQLNVKLVTLKTENRKLKEKGKKHKKNDQSRHEAPDDANMTDEDNEANTKRKAAKT